jgi:ABC-type Fe3+-hydroxamate transport system substrate-binding protein
MPARLPRRIVSLVPSLTQSLADLGAGERIVGVTDYCPAVPGVTGPTRIGGPLDPDPARIAALAPDLIIACREENPRRPRARLHGIAPIALFSCRTYDEGIDLVAAIGRIIGAPQRASSVTRRLRRERVRLRGRVPRVVRVFYPVWRDPWLSAAQGSFVADMLGLAGGLSIHASGALAFPRVSLENALRRAPEAVLLPDEPWPFREADCRLFAQTPAGRRGRVRCVPGRWAAWYGTRMDAGLAGLVAAIHGTEAGGVSWPGA